MKKIYSSPTTTVVVMQTSVQFLTTSSLGFGDNVESASEAETKELGDWKFEW